MATVQHSALPNAELHEPKDVSGAAINTTYVADGAGSGDWGQAPYTYVVTYVFEDISTADTNYVVAPVAGNIVNIYSVIDGAIATSDCALSFAIGGTPITSSGITITQSGSAAGDIDSSTPTADNTLSAGSRIDITSDGASANSVNATITFEIQVNFS